MPTVYTKSSKSSDAKASLLDWVSGKVNSLGAYCFRLRTPKNVAASLSLMPRASLKQILPTLTLYFMNSTHIWPALLFQDCLGQWVAAADPRRILDKIRHGLKYPVVSG